MPLTSSKISRTQAISSYLSQSDGHRQFKGQTHDKTSESTKKEKSFKKVLDEALTR